GIASSASGMSALALCLCSIEEKLFDQVKERPDFEKKASYMARLGSGSACRSIFSRGAIWGENADIEAGSDLYAIPFNEELHESFQDVQDTILLISRSEKSVSSRAGHQLMENNIYADNRYNQAKQRLHQLLPALRNGDWETFGAITETEAMTLHALMMTSIPPYILMEPNTLEAINRIRSFRANQKLPVYFTLDAGPNIHLLYPSNIKEQVNRFIDESLKVLCAEGQFIQDHAGIGPVEF
ncbi:MAG: diphosphomevalonate decarboxylase, partial [Bacteroidota bacterium]